MKTFKTLKDVFTVSFALQKTNTKLREINSNFIKKTTTTTTKKTDKFVSNNKTIYIYIYIFFSKNNVSVSVFIFIWVYFFLEFFVTIPKNKQ